MKRSIRWQLLLSFVLLASLIIGSLSLITFRLMENHFEDYVSQRQEDLLNRFAGELEESYAANGVWTEQSVAELAREAMHNGVTLTLYGLDGELLWSMGGHMMGHMQYTEETFPLTYQDEEIGSAVLGYMGPVAYTQQDLQFIGDMRNYLLLIGVLALLASLLFATWLARRFSKPIVQVSRFTEEIARGHYRNQLPEETAIREIDELIGSVNELSQQLENQQEIRNRLSSNLAHEIRTPLTTLKGNIEAMLDGVWEVTPERLRHCHQEVDRIARLISDIDRINEIESHHKPLQLTDFDLAALARRIAANFAGLAQEKGLEVQAEGEALMIRADEDKISQVITNLLANAIKFTPSGGTIQLDVRREGSQALFRINDTGAGIRPEDLDKVFERFYMAEPSRNSELGGKGIGLSIVKSLVQAHNGTITVDSVYGKGTTFTVRLPLTGKSPA